MAMEILSIDIETYSSRDLTKCGVYAYTQAEDFEILLFGYAFDDEEVKVIDLKNGEELPKEVKEALRNPTIIKTAYNANFERTCIAAHFKTNMPPEQWKCTAVNALELGLPTSLDATAKCLKLPQQKMIEGKALIRYFSMPCKGTKANRFRNRNLPEHDKDKWNTFKSYCGKDVEVERNIRKQLDKYQITKNEQKLWCLDQKINDMGVKVESELINHALACDSKYQERLKDEAANLTGIENPKSITQMKKWLLEAEGLEVETLSKETVANLLNEVTNDDVKRALELRQELSKTSIKKYEAMDKALCKDNRIRGLLQFYGANRTGRWAGRLVQVQNLPQNKLKDLDLARNLLKEGKYETLEMLFDSVPDVLSQLIRTAFIPSDDSRFIVADFSAIEARVIAWLAGEKWRMDVFNSHGKIYEASASQMFKVPIETITKGSQLRQKGKVAELALGYQGSKGALLAMGALKMGLKEEELPELVTAWRNSNSKIAKLWSDVEKAAITTVKDKTAVTIQHGIEFSFESGIFFIKLPSGRKLSYVRPSIDIDERFNKPMIRLDDAGYKILMHIHDEVVLDVPYDFGSLENVGEIMGTPISWAKGLPLRADAFETNYYKKD
jgi:DNA polymerase